VSTSESDFCAPVRRRPPSGPAPTSSLDASAASCRACATASTRSSLRMLEVPEIPSSRAASRNSSTLCSRSSVSLTSGVFGVWLPGASAITYSSRARLPISHGYPIALGAARPTSSRRHKHACAPPVSRATVAGYRPDRMPGNDLRTVRPAGRTGETRRTSDQALDRLVVADVTTPSGAWNSDPACPAGFGRQAAPTRGEEALRRLPGGGADHGSASLKVPRR
jgi:hypothetical protein